MSRKSTPKKHVINFTHYCVSALDENKRFVYGQAYLQANWLKFLVFRPSDKSIEMCDIGYHLRNNFLDDLLFTYDINSNPFKKCINFWKVEEISKVQKVTHYLGSSECFENLSETADKIAGFSEESDSDYY